MRPMPVTSMTHRIGTKNWLAKRVTQKYALLNQIQKPMRTLQCILSLLCAVAAGSASAQITVTVTQGEETDLAAAYDSTDLIQGLIPAALPGDQGWHSANTDPLDTLPAFTGGQGVRPTGLTC